MTIRESRARLRAAESAYNSAKHGRDLTEARHELTCARAEYQGACVELVSQLEEVLEPWHEESEQWHQDHPHEDVIYTIHDCDDLHEFPIDNITIGDLRRLSSIYKEITDA